MATLNGLLEKKGRRILLLGPSGSGKTTAIGMLAKHYDVFILDTDGNILPLMEYVPAEFHSRLHIEPIKDNVTLDSKTGRLRPTGKAEAWARIITLLKHGWTDGETKESFGNITSWKGDRVLVVDSLTNLETPAWNYTLSLNSSDRYDKFNGRPQIADWQDAINLETALFKNLVYNDLQCHIVLAAHLKHLRVMEQPTDEEHKIETQEREKKRLANTAAIEKARQQKQAGTSALEIASQQRAERELEKQERAERMENKQKLSMVSTFERYPNVLGQGLPANLGADFDFMVYMDRKGENKPRIRTTPLADVSLKCPANSSRIPQYLPIENGLHTLITSTKGT